MISLNHIDRPRSQSQRRLIETPPNSSHDINEIVQDERQNQLPLQSTTTEKVPTTVASRPIQIHTFSRFAPEVFLTILPCLFIALAVVAATLNGRQTSSYGEKVEQAAKLGPTIFPIAFAAIATRFNRHLATWQAERGQRLGMLEQLMQSQSLAGSFLAAWNQGSLSIVGFSMALVWLFSPVGGQASLRVLTTSAANIRIQTPVYTAGQDTMRYFGGGSHYTSDQQKINGLFVASLLAPEDVWTGPVDTWGNVKIPATKYVTDLGHEEWYTVNESSSTTNYSSLIGIPTFGVPRLGTANFTIDWPVFTTECDWDLHAYTLLRWCNYSIGMNTHSVPNNCTLNQTTGFVTGPSYDGPGLLDTDNHGANMTQLYSNSTPQYLNISYTIHSWTKANNITYSGAKAQCRLRTTRTKAEVFCNSGSCRVSRYRKSNDSRPAFINPVEISFEQWNDATVRYQDRSLKMFYFTTMLQYLPQTTGSTEFGSATPFEAFLNGWMRPFNQSNIGYVNWTSTTSADFSERLSIALNTFWIASQWGDEITDHSERNSTKFINTTTGAPYEQYQRTTGDFVQQQPVYNANYLWIALLLVSSMVLLACTLTSFVLGFYTLAPDILGYVSSLTRDNLYCEPMMMKKAKNDMKSGVSVMSGNERARMMRNVRLQIVDVRPEAEVGHVAAVVVDGTGISTASVDVGEDGQKDGYVRLRKGRFYD